MIWRTTCCRRTQTFDRHFVGTFAKCDIRTRSRLQINNNNNNISKAWGMEFHAEALIEMCQYLSVIRFGQFSALAVSVG